MANLASLLRLPGNFKDTQWQVLAGPVLILLILSMMVLPLPAFILDLLFTFNIALSIMVLLVAMFTQRTLEFAAFPTILLFSTLLRLSLNVASTRIILLEGHTGSAAAGRVVEAFGHFLVGGNFAIGIVVFIILVLINFMVITKGAGRIAEVGARFVLDGMPGKQMAIDADLNAGLIGEDEAKKRRAEVTQEADFYGSMDGASKFVRGDAIAGLMIMVLNVVGGLLVGVVQHGMELGAAAESYTLLTIGDGLVAQIPALVDLHRRRRYRHPRRDRSGRRRADGGPAVQQSARDAVERRGARAVGPGAGHAEPGVPAVYRGSVGSCLVAARP